MKCIFQLVILLILFFNVRAQDIHEAPSLQVGLSGINFSRGTLDAELIAEIIVEKQKEVRNRLIKNLLLNNLGVDNGLFYSYIDNTIDIITTEKDEDTRIKNLVENTVNLSFVLAYTEYYLYTLRPGSPEHSNLKALAMIYGLQNAEITPPVSLKDLSKIKYHETEKSGNWVSYSSGGPKEDRNRFIGILIDLFAEVIRTNNDLKQLGLLRTNYFQNVSALNAYLGLEDRNIKDQADKVFADVVNNLTLHLKYFGLIKSVASRGSDFYTALAELTNNFNCGDEAARGRAFNALFTSSRASIPNISSLPVKESESLVLLNSFSEKLAHIDLNQYEYIAQYEKDIKPAIELLAKHSTDFLLMRDNITEQLYCLNGGVKAELDKINIKVNLSFIKVLSRLNEFDKIDTYDLYLNLLSEAGDVFSDEKMRSSINRVISFLRSYIKITRDEQNKILLNLDTEGFILGLQKIQYPKWRPIEFHFTVGMNNLAFRKLLAAGEDSIRNFSFVSEKVGLKIKLWDWKYLNSFTRGETYTYYWVNYERVSPPKEPTFSNIHLLFYGSGLLYNIFDTGTSKNFNAPIVGLGAGFTFFNSLDLSFSWGRPIITDKEFFAEDVPGYFNVGFDIQFIEYINRLTEKRQARKIQKKLAEASGG